MVPLLLLLLSALASVVAVCAVDESVSLFPSIGTSAWRGRGRTNWGCHRAVDAIRLYVSSEIQAQMEFGSFTWRKRHRLSISLGGSARIFSTSKYELRGLIPPLSLKPETAADVAAWGLGGGGGWNAERAVGEKGSGVAGVEAPLRRSWILSL